MCDMFGFAIGSGHQLVEQEDRVPFDRGGCEGKKELLMRWGRVTSCSEKEIPMLRKVSTAFVVMALWSSGALFAQGKGDGPDKHEARDGKEGRRGESLKIGTL